ncbi:hypothetical protein BaRGS_00009463 [Batillaria attramentaria]|uniref:Uncharacterized protein n=1 Tax=Batillaria attramentaria TaxID=370345 RepID=A0ABD0LJB8_9CAEN
MKSTRTVPGMSKNTDNTTSAHILFWISGSDARCDSAGGNCQTDSIRCSGSYRSGLCSGPTNRRCCIPSSGSDSRCTSRGGTCQDSSRTCGGYYKSGLCSGPATRRCCHPTSGEGPCSRRHSFLACQVFRSSNVRAAQRHPSGVSDNAYAYNNLRDMCSPGGKAARSSYSCNVCRSGTPGGSVCLSIALLEYLVELQDSGTVIINELAGACHSCMSRHYSGLAVDLHKKDFNGRDRTADYMRRCRNNGGVAIDEGSHVHCQFSDVAHPNGFQ